MSNRKLYLLVSVIMLLCGTVWSQSKSLDSLCDIRGHIESEIVLINDVYCGDPYLIETKCKTVKVTPVCERQSICVRCFRWFTIEQTELKKVVWMKSRSITHTYIDECDLGLIWTNADIPNLHPIHTIRDE